MLEQMIDKADKETRDEYESKHVPKCIVENQYKINADHYRKF